VETVPAALNNPDERRLQVPSDVMNNAQALELASVWFSNNKVKIMTRTGTGLDRNPAIWGEILAGIGENIAVCLQEATSASPSQTLATIKKSLDERWRAGATRAADGASRPVFAPGEAGAERDVS
jgi:hypothetical protein